MLVMVDDQFALIVNFLPCLVLIQVYMGLLQQMVKAAKSAWGTGNWPPLCHGGRLKNQGSEAYMHKLFSSQLQAKLMSQM